MCVCLNTHDEIINTKTQTPQWNECKAYVFNIYILTFNHYHSQGYPFADLFSSFGEFSVSHHSDELNPIIKENRIAALKTEDGKVPQVDMLSAETIAKVFESRAKFKVHPPIEFRTASICDDIEIPILIIDGNESTTFIRRLNGNSTDKFDWKNYPKVADIDVNTHNGYKQTLENIFAEVSRRSKQSHAPLKYRPVASLIQGGQNVNELVDNNSLIASANNNDEQHQQMAHTPCTNSLCNGQQAIDRSNFPILNFFSSFIK